MPDISIIKLKVRRGTDAQRLTVVLEQGELGYVIDTNRLYVGDGITVGGTPVSQKIFGPVASVASLTQLNGAGLYDIAPVNSMLFQLTGSDYTNAGSWGPIGAKTDNITLGISNNGDIQIKDNGITGNKFAPSSVFNQGGIIATTNNGLSANVDSTTIKINSNRLTVGTLSASQISRNLLGNGLIGGDGTRLSINADASTFGFVAGVLALTAFPDGVVDAFSLSADSVGPGLYVDTDNKLKANIQSVNSTLTINGSKQLGITAILPAGSTQFSNITYNNTGQITGKTSAIYTTITGNQSTNTILSTFNGFPQQTKLTNQSRIAAVSSNPSGTTVNITLTSAGFITLNTTDYGLVSIPIFK